KTPPGHGPGFDDVALQDGVVGGIDLAVFDVADGKIFMRVIARQHYSAPAWQERVVDVAGVGRGGPVQFAQDGGTFFGGDVEDEFVVGALEADGKNQGEVERRRSGFRMPAAGGDFDADLEAGVVRLDGNFFGVDEAQGEFGATRFRDHVVRAGGNHCPFG